MTQLLSCWRLYYLLTFRFLEGKFRHLDVFRCKVNYIQYHQFWPFGEHVLSAGIIRGSVFNQNHRRTGNDATTKCSSIESNCNICLMFYSVSREIPKLLTPENVCLQFVQVLKRILVAKLRVMSFNFKPGLALDNISSYIGKHVVNVKRGS